MDASQDSSVTPTPPPLSRLAPVSVIHAAGGAFAAGLADLQPGSLHLKGVPLKLALRDQVTVLLFGRRLAGEVSDTGDGELSVEFETSPDIFETIEAFEDYQVHDDPSGGFNDCRSTVFAEVTPVSSLDALPALDAEGRLTPQNSLDGLGILYSLRASRPVMVRSDRNLSVAKLDVGGQAFELRMKPVSGKGYLVFPPSGTEAVDAAIAKLQQELDARHPTENIKAPENDYDDDLPLYHPDGSITFRSFSQFLFQADCNLSKGAVMAKGFAGELGSKRALKLLIPEASPIDIPSAELLFHDQGRVGFSVNQPHVLRMAIQQAISESVGRTLHGRPAPTPAPVLRPAATPAPTIVPWTHRVELSSALPSPHVLTDFARSSADITAAGGWYVGVLDRALRMGKDLEVTVTNDVESLRIWIHRAHVVAAMRRPAPGEDRLGQRLVAKRTVTSTLLRDALKVALNAKDPLGQVLIQTGKVPPAQVHRALRYQLLDRIAVPQEWTSGWIEINEMSRLPIKADLVALSRSTAAAHLLRRQLSKARLAELRDTMRRYLNQPLLIDLSRLSPSYRLTEREQQFFTKCANTEGSLAAMISQATARPLEGYRILLLGIALGIVTLSEPTPL